MALLVKSMCSRLANRLLKNPCPDVTKVLSSSLLHTVGIPTTSSNIYIPQAAAIEAKSVKCQLLLSACGKLMSPTPHVPIILPCLPHGKAPILDLPALPTLTNLEMPTSDAFLDNAHIMPVNIKIEEPDSVTQVEKLAIRMLVIRRKKIKKHRRRKRFKKNFVYYSRIRQARKAAKEKNLQTQLLSQMNEARGFGARQYAFELLSAAYEKVELPAKHIRKKPWEV